ncbi:hypothetical protein T4D_2776, partial [Trichinella pseudospiralis]
LDAHAVESANRQSDIESGPQIIEIRSVSAAIGSSSSNI